MIAVITAVLLVVAVAAGLLSVLGMALLPDPYDKLHFLGPVSTVGAVALLAAVAVTHGWSVTTGRTGLVVLILMVTGPVLTHATARSVLTHPGDDVEGREWTVTD